MLRFDTTKQLIAAILLLCGLVARGANGGFKTHREQDLRRPARLVSIQCGPKNITITEFQLRVHEKGHD